MVTKSKVTAVKKKTSNKLKPIALLTAAEVNVKTEFNLYKPEFNDNGTFTLKLKGTASITPRVTNWLSCGFSLKLPSNTKLSVFAKPEYAAKGVILTCDVLGTGDYVEVKVYFHNTGKEIFAIANGDLLGTACIETTLNLVPNYV